MVSRFTSRVARFVSEARAWVDQRGMRLRDRLRRHGNVTSANADRLLREALIKRQTVGELRRVLGAYLEAGPPRSRADVLVANEMRRTHALARRDAAIERDELLEYHTSIAHPEPDQCDGYESADVGYGPGVYPPEIAPLPPTHIGCLCYVTRRPRPTRVR